MIDFAYAARHLHGVWRLVRGDKDWREDMDFTLDGVFASFWAILIAAPFALVFQTAYLRVLETTPDYDENPFSGTPTGALIAIDVLVMIVGWAVAITVLLFAVKSLGATRQAAGLIVSFNWSQCLGAILAAAPGLAFIATGSANLFTVLALPAGLFGVYLLWAVLRGNLPTISLAGAIGLMATLIVFDIAVTSIATSALIGLYQLVS